MAHRSLTVAAFFAPALLLAQTNLDFKQGEPGAEPPGWVVPPGVRTAGYKAELRREGCHSANGCAVVINPAAPPPDTYGDLQQSFSAEPYRGKMVRLSAWLRVESRTPIDRAQMWMKVTLPNGQQGFYDNMGDRPIKSAEWARHEIIGEVAPDAVSIGIGLMSFNLCRAWVDDVRIEVVDQSGPEVAAAREALGKMYAATDAAYARGDIDAVAAPALPDATLKVGPNSMPLSAALGQIRADIKSGWKYANRSALTGILVDGDTARVSVNGESTRTMGSESRAVVTTSRDTWVKTAAGWRLKESTLVSVRITAPPTNAETAKAVAAELKQSAVPLAGVDPAMPPTDLAAFGKAVGDARIVALGEATHGTREFFQMKHRLLDYLVKEKGFTVFAIEGNWPESLAVDRYIKTGEGDARSALAGMYFWTWQTQEVLDMVEWMRDFNKAPGKHPILTFTSFDMQTASVAARRALDYLNRYASDEAGPAAASYTAVQDLEARRAEMVDATANTAALKAAAVLKVFDSKRAELIAASGAAAWRDARQAANIVYQACTLRKHETGQAYRDEMMAGNFEWLASQVYPTEKIVLWAHNDHVASTSVLGYKAMGGWLRSRYGKQVYLVGFAFLGGELRAVGSSAGHFTGVTAQTAPPSPEGSGDAVLSAAGMPLFFLDMASAPPGGALARWLAEPHLFHDVGAVWNSEDPESSLLPAALSKCYDGLIFVETSHAAKGL